MPLIIIKKGFEEIERKPFDKDVEIISIGRGSSNDIDLSYLDNPKKPVISRHHAAIIKNKLDNYFIRDLSSKNGTKINKELVYRKLLEDGDEIEIGNVILVFKEYYVNDNDEKRIIVISEEDEKKLFEHLYLNNTYEDIFNNDSISDTWYETFYMPPQELQEGQSTLSKPYKDLLEDIYKLIKSIPDIQILLKEIMNTVFDILKPQKGYIGYKSKDGGLISIVIRGFETELWLPLLPSMDKVVFKRGEMFCSKGNRILGIPLKRAQDVLGLIYLQKTDGFSDEEIVFLKLFVDYFARHSNRFQQKTVNEEKFFPSEYFVWKSEMVGNKKTFIGKIQEKIDALAKVDENVLILGETRTGKELVARAIHKNSNRKGNFIEINISLYEKTWLEDELLGREKNVLGPGTPAKKGAFERANKGTLFLDEIGDLKIEHQNKILKVIEDKVVTRMGGENPIPVDVRIIAATNRDLKEGIKKKWFREDLYYRFQHKIEVMPLRERKEDILLLAHYFIDKYSGKYSTKTKGISSQAKRLLMGYDWPGNIGELENVILEAVLKDREIILPEDLHLEIQQIKDKDGEDKRGCEKIVKDLNKVECEEIKKALHLTNWNVSEAARRLGVSHAGIYLKMKKYGIKRSQ